MKSEKVNGYIRGRSSMMENQHWLHEICGRTLYQWLLVLSVIVFVTGCATMQSSWNKATSANTCTLMSLV